MAVPYFVPACRAGQGRRRSRRARRIVVGGIGIQNRGMHDLKWIMRSPEVQFVAICDLQKKQRLAIKGFVDKHYGTKDCAMYPEINGFLEARPDIDAVLTATGDRWHALASILAMRAGKDVYTEKPSCMTIAEGRAVVETARRYGRVYQTGTQRLSEAEPRVLHRDGPHRTSRRDPHGLRPYRSLGRGRDASRLAAGRRRAAQG